MDRKYRLYGWPLSYYTGKIRCYLIHKGIPFEERAMSLYTLAIQAKRHTGARAMPVLVTPQGDWLQDSSSIIDNLEARFSDHPALPATPVQRFAALLLETWFDEWWIPAAMHSRWSFAENYPLFEAEAGAALLPWFPKSMQRRAARKTADMLRGYLKYVGVRPDQMQMIETNSVAVLDMLETHFSQHPFLLGGQASIADFGLAGPIHAHLGRDPWPKRNWVDPRPNLCLWHARIGAVGAANSNSALGVNDRRLRDDEIPETLLPVFDEIVAGFLPMIAANVQKLQEMATGKTTGFVFPRVVGSVIFPMAGKVFTRSATPFVLWKIQRLQDAYKQMSPGEQDKVQHWLDQIGGRDLLDFQIPRLRRTGLKVALG